MDETTFKEYAQKLDAVAKVIEKLPAEIRVAAFNMLESYITGDAAPKSKDKNTQTNHKNSSDYSESLGMEEFFSAHDHDKPADNVKLITAYLYNDYGCEPFTTDDIKQIANDVGITIPDRPDATLKATKDKGKTLFISAGRGKFRVTVHGEAYLKNAYSVKKGKKQKAAAE